MNDVSRVKISLKHTRPQIQNFTMKNRLLVINTLTAQQLL